MERITLGLPISNRKERTVAPEKKTGLYASSPVTK
jgi:hypothetical protein